MSKTTFAVIVLMVTVFKFIIASCTLGTNDVKYWQYFMQYIVTYDSVSVYRNIPIYNHPPFMSIFLSWIYPVTEQFPGSFPLLMRCPSILADIGNSYLAYFIARSFLTEKKAWLSGIIVATSPVLIQISGFHGNTDPVFICLLMLSFYLLFVRKLLLPAGLVFGMAFNIKIVPIICIPFFFFFIDTWKRRGLFFLMTAIPVIAGFAYNIIRDPQPILRNVFLYKSLEEIWGITKFAAANWSSWLKLLLVLAILITTALLAQRAKHADQEKEKIRYTAIGLGLTFLIFLVLTPGFGVQYLSWLAPTGVFLGLTGTLFYNIIAGSFLFSVYTYWSGGFPWYMADSDIAGPWIGLSSRLDSILWAYMAAWLLILLYQSFFIKAPQKVK